jgi:hypothetical protein
MLTRSKPLAGNGTRFGERRAEVGNPLETVFARLGGTEPRQGVRRDEPGVVKDHERRQQPIVYESERQAAVRIGPTERTAETDVAETRYRIERQAVIPEVEC